MKMTALLECQAISSPPPSLTGCHTEDSVGKKTKIKYILSTYIVIELYHANKTVSIRNKIEKRSGGIKLDYFSLS